MSKTYVESFDQSCGGWTGWISNAKGAARLDRRDGYVVSRSPWWVDYNHAPPGGGYLHLLFALQTKPHFSNQAKLDALGGANRFIDGGYPTNFTNARVTLRLRGEVNLRGAQMLLHAQAKVGEVYVNQCMIGQPFSIQRDWTEQTIELIPDATQWKSLGTRHDRTAFYGPGDIGDVLRDVNGNIILILYPLDIVPTSPAPADHHLAKAGEDYEIDRDRLPSGYVMLDEVRIAFDGRGTR
jgi:hypothetical protein